METSYSRKRPRLLKNNKKDEIRKDFVTTVFSKELVLNVFSFLSSKDLIQCAAVSMEWSRLANDEMLWKPLFYKRFRDPLLLEDKKSKFHYHRRSSVTRYRGSWKAKYRVHHNWLLGNCYINDIENTFDIKDNTLLDHHQLQFFHDIIFIAQSNSSVINVWKYVENKTTLEFSLESTESRGNNGYITFLKFTEGSNSSLVAGYSNGGFTVWDISGSCFKELSIKESINYRPSDITINDKITAIAMEYPMIVICTESMTLSVFYVNKHRSLDMVHCLHNPIDCSSIVINIKKRIPKTNEKRQSNCKEDVWQAIVCFGMFGGGGLAASVGIQELNLSRNRLLSSRYGYALDYAFSNDTAASSEQITAMAYAPPFLITAHPNNTMKQYIVRVNDHELDISFKRKLYGHTFKVDVLAIDAARRKLVSGDRSGIRVWDLAKHGECQVVLGAHKDQSSMTELPNLRMNTLGFDEDKIIAVVNTLDQSFVRLWSFNSLK
ncbi:hypothetical protein INT48_006948 [Thamnidium elegans]|uniref:F-box domain-containing protein n=1 Tax=Thamnidium elegans TaxID=101142 RepID=A0A8H7SWD4_9FUNG|nr:hypothetical protein INT48_006948 [Thamnidium elegans]